MASPLGRLTKILQDTAFFDSLVPFVGVWSKTGSLSQMSSLYVFCTNQSVLARTCPLKFCRIQPFLTRLSLLYVFGPKQAVLSQISSLYVFCKIQNVLARTCALNFCRIQPFWTHLSLLCVFDPKQAVLNQISSLNVLLQYSERPCSFVPSKILQVSLF